MTLDPTTETKGHVTNVALPDTLFPPYSEINNSSGFFLAHKHERKINVCLSAMENRFELLIEE